MSLKKSLSFINKPFFFHANDTIFTDKNFFDYTQSHINFDVMDLYLISKCKFYVGTQSGILDLAYMFNKPVLTTNMCELFRGS